MSYPARKDQLIQHARGNKAGDGAIRALEEIPDREYSGPDQVSKAVAKCLNRAPLRCTRGLRGRGGRCLRLAAPG